MLDILIDAILGLLVLYTFLTPVQSMWNHAFESTLWDDQTQFDREMQISFWDYNEPITPIASVNPVAYDHFTADVPDEMQRDIRIQNEGMRKQQPTKDVRPEFILPSMTRTGRNFTLNAWTPKKGHNLLPTTIASLTGLD